ncbi:UDP-N-acetylmuramoyl-tripeptide--D-alanyl-D-alanine ligase [Alkaliphilus pronyensis]|uniref:UDP-N-acetylmuramoyl-tripeptide--D-alanyl-D-alanine ligase n=1 Tax=Alkaliphilus pronyensis TaxID=1482732 RepID=A0A6I0FKE1_9FIRM|nr:UDP-N-acetylmuramoyl-tripeptide--D-alanyl-D-alanine ligase [Alkaliphilus pronyensis]KAB3538593.1 UDP-N-acetylmuramoyl-tripeptide--D-alanyl-D-alanine ligase [Alkaliphilus pronyensis]
MMTLTYEEICKACNGSIISYGKTETAKGVSTDTRAIEKDMLFVPLVGERFDGHTFIKEAQKRGASGALVEGGKAIDTKEYEDFYLIQVKDTPTALSNLSKYFRDKFKIPFIGVTGSTGKTSTKDMIASVLSSKFSVLKTIGNFNNHIGLPLTLFNLEEHHQFAVLEMGMSALGEISNLVKIVKPEIGVITNIGMSHIEHLGSKANIMKAKMEITEYMNEGNYLLVNGDDEYLQNLKGIDTPYEKVFFGLSKDNDFYPIEVNQDNGYNITIAFEGENYIFNLPQYGIHNVYNGLAAIWIGKHYGVSPSEIQKAFNDYSPTKMRMEIIEINNYRIINDAYNANPDSMKAAIDVVSNLKGGRRIAVLGNMLEMGKFSEEGHRIVGSYLAKSKANMLITVGKDAAWIAKEVIKGNSNIDTYIVNSNKEAYEKLSALIQADDIILIKGSRGMQMEEIITFLQERS